MQLLNNLSPDSLASYTSRQIANFFPDQEDPGRNRIAAHQSEALERLRVCIDAVRMWQPGQFNHLHSSQYCLYLYFLSNTIWRNTGDSAICTKLFLLNKALNGIDCYFEIDMPEIFFIGHSVGIVLAKATYSNYLVLYQNSTVGKNHGVAPRIGEGVIMYPNSAIIGRCEVGANTVVAQGVGVVNRSPPGNAIAYGGSNGDLVFKPLKVRAAEEFFRI
jgi:serine O-acetyltransferase